MTGRRVIPADVVDLFAGPGGWDEGLRAAGFTGGIVGIDNDPDACTTAWAAGHARILGDLEQVGPELFERPVDGLVGSPSCRDDSATGSRLGVAGPHGRLSLIPARWALALRPRWVALEQVPGALGVYRDTAAQLEAAGYWTWVGIVAADQHGVPQQRRRVVLLARLDGPVVAPVPSTSAGRSMLDALGSEFAGAVLVSNYGTGGDAKRRGRRPSTRPAFTMTGKCGRNRWEWPDGTTRNLTPREAATLQGFRPDYPWQGGSTSVQQQIGDAVPPPLAAALVAPLLTPARAAVAA